MSADAKASSPCPCKVVIVDGHRAVRELLSRALTGRSRAPIRSPAWATAARKPWTLCRRLQPDLLVLEMVLPGGCGLDVLERLRQEQPEIRVVFFTGCEQRALFAQAVGWARADTCSRADRSPCWSK